MVNTKNNGSPQGTIKVPGLGTNAPKPGQVLPGDGVPGLRVPQTAHAVRAVDETGTMTGMIPVIGKAKAQSNAGPALPGVKPVVIQGNKPIIPDKPAVPVPQSRPATQISQLHAPGAPIPPSTTGMIPSATPSSGPAPHEPGGTPKLTSAAKPASPQTKPGGSGAPRLVPIITDAKTGTKSRPTPLVTDVKTGGSSRPAPRPNPALGGVKVKPPNQAERPPSPVPVPGAAAFNGTVAPDGSASRPGAPADASAGKTAPSGGTRPGQVGMQKPFPPSAQNQAAPPPGSQAGAQTARPGQPGQPAGQKSARPGQQPGLQSARPAPAPGTKFSGSQPASQPPTARTPSPHPGLKPTQLSGQPQPTPPAARPGSDAATPSPDRPQAVPAPQNRPQPQPGQNSAVSRSQGGKPPTGVNTPVERLEDTSAPMSTATSSLATNSASVPPAAVELSGTPIGAVPLKPAQSKDLPDTSETEAPPRGGQIVRPQSQNSPFAGDAVPHSPGTKFQFDSAEGASPRQRPEMPPQNPHYPGMQGIPPTPGIPSMGRYPAIPGMPGMPGRGGMPGMPGMPGMMGRPGMPGMPGMPMPGMPGRPGYPSAGPYGWARPPRGPYGYGMPMPPRAAWGEQQSRSSRREALKDIEARQIQELKEAEEASHQAEIEALKSQAERFGGELSDEEIEDIDWDDFEETFTERLIRKSGRWGETILMVGQAARWALVVLVTVLVVVILIFALDRSATQKIASGFETRVSASGVVDISQAEVPLRVNKSPDYQHLSIYHTGGV